jgi:hypothetical protein
MANDWNDEELSAAVAAYNKMARCDAERKPYAKRQIYRDLAEQFGRTEKSFEYRMQNISAVLDDLGEPWVAGLKPAANVGSSVRERIKSLLIQTATERAPKSKSHALYKQELPAIRDWLIRVAQNRGTVRYGEVMKAFGIGFRNIRRVMDYLGHQSENLDEPIITALIVNADGRCSSGFEKEFGVTDDARERIKLYEYWANTSSSPANVIGDSGTIELKAARFVSVEARPEQAAFRRAVFLAHNGACVITGCDVVATLDAAHKVGRDWRLGQNRADDGYLLRKDLHALYDNGLLLITEDGTVHIHSSISSHYGHLHGKRIRRATTDADAEDNITCGV